MKAYVYKITNTITNQYYFGSRYANVRANRAAVDELWIYYFTSSSTIKRIIAALGKDSFTTEILHESSDIDEIYWAEQELIKEHIANGLCLNKKYQDKDQGHEVFITANKPSWNKGLPSKYKGVPRSTEVKSKISEGRKGKHTGVPPKNKGVPRTAAEKQSQSEKMKGRLVKEKNGFYQKTHSDEVKKFIAENTSKAQKGRVKPKMPCPHCGKPISAHQWTRHTTSCLRKIKNVS